jgi:hypothetical protein
MYLCCSPERRCRIAIAPPALPCLACPCACVLLRATPRVRAVFASSLQPLPLGRQPAHAPHMSNHQASFTMYRLCLVKGHWLLARFVPESLSQSTWLQPRDSLHLVKLISVMRACHGESCSADTQHHSHKTTHAFRKVRLCPPVDHGPWHSRLPLAPINLSRRDHVRIIGSGTFDALTNIAHRPRNHIHLAHGLTNARMLPRQSPASGTRSLSADRHH